MNQLVESIDALGNVTSYTYDLLGNLLSATDPLGAITTYEYDALGRVTKITGPDPDGDPVTTPNDAPWTVYAYDAEGNLASVTDRLGHATSYTYDDLSRVLTVTDAEQGVTEYAYDAVGNLTSLTDPEGNVTTYVYDNLNRLAEERVTIDSVPYSRYYIYDAAGNLARYIDRNGRVTDYEHDNLGRTTAENWLDSYEQVFYTISYTYDSAGRLVEVSDDAATYEYEYDPLGRVIEETQTIAGLSSVIVLSRQYDSNGQRTQLSATIGGVADFVNDYSYDSLGRLTTLTQQGVVGGNAVAEKRVDFTYNARSQYATVARYADLAATDLVALAEYDYDSLGRLTDLVYTQPNSTGLPFYGWTYDAANRMTWMETIDGEVDYAHDDTDQLTTADYDYATDESYAYDENGNRLAYTTGDHNRLLYDGTYTYEYDPEGNRTVRYNDVDENGTLTEDDTDITFYTWDNRNRLTMVEHTNGIIILYGEPMVFLADMVVIYDYDCFNRLISRSYAPDGRLSMMDIEQSIYVYDNNQIVLQFDKNGTGDLTAADLSHRYLWNLQAVDQLFTDEQVHWDEQSEDFVTDELLWALTDNLGSVRDMAVYDPVTWQTTIENHRVYDAFGNLKSETNAAVDCVFGFTGLLYDEATKLSFSRTRPYEASTGRWLGEDWIGLRGGPNPYAYCSNSPLTHTDPLGLCSENTGDGVNAVLCATTTKSKSTAKPRPWKDKNGQPLKDDKGHEVGEATVVAATKNVIILRKADGTIVKVNRKDLSKDDKKYVATVKLGYKVYFVSRPLEATKPIKKKGGVGKAEPDLPGNHTFIYVVDDEGNVIAVFSWMSGATKDTRYWSQGDRKHGNPDDWAAAEDDVARRKNGKGVGTLIGSADDSYIDALTTARRLLATDPNGNSGHPNGLAFGNCKMEARKLAALADIVALYGEAYAKQWIKDHRWYDPPGEWGPRTPADPVFPDQ